MERFCKFGKLHAIKGNCHKLLSILLTASKELEDVDNCFCYIVGQDETDLDAVYVYEVWEDKEAHKQSLDLPAIKKLITSAMPILDMSKRESYPDLTIYGGKASF